MQACAMCTSQAANAHARLLVFAAISITESRVPLGSQRCATNVRHAYSSKTHCTCCVQVAFTVSRKGTDACRACSDECLAHDNAPLALCEHAGGQSCVFSIVDMRAGAATDRISLTQSSVHPHLLCHPERPNYIFTRCDSVRPSTGRAKLPCDARLLQPSRHAM